MFSCVCDTLLISVVVLLHLCSCVCVPLFVLLHLCFCFCALAFILLCLCTWVCAPLFCNYCLFSGLCPLNARTHILLIRIMCLLVDNALLVRVCSICICVFLACAHQLIGALVVIEENKTLQVLVFVLLCSWLVLG